MAADAWRDIIQRLISHGHRAEDVARYTLGQVRAYQLAIVERERRAQAHAILAARFGAMVTHDIRGIVGGLLNGASS